MKFTLAFRHLAAFYQDAKTLCKGALCDVMRSSDGEASLDLVCLGCSCSSNRDGACANALDAFCADKLGHSTEIGLV